MRGREPSEGVKRGEKLKNTRFELNDLPFAGGWQGSFHVEHSRNTGCLSRAMSGPTRPLSAPTPIVRHGRRGSQNLPIVYCISFMQSADRELSRQCLDWWKCWQVFLF